MSNKAAWLTEAKARPLKVDDAPMPKAGPNEVIIKNHAVAINPVDWKMQDFGLFFEKYPNVLGTDAAGEVYEVGSGVTNVKKGDRVIGHGFSLVTNDPSEGCFQLYSKHNAVVVSKIPSSLSYASAAVLPLALSTAAAVLFKKEALALPLPSVNAKPTNKSVLVWGGSSSVGATAIQLAVGAGVTVVSVASKHNLDKVKALGAKHVFDYNSPTVTEDILSALQGTEFAGVADMIGTEDSAKAWVPVYEKLGGRYGTVLQDQPLPSGIQGCAVFAPSIASGDDKFIGEATWGSWVPEALAQGKLLAKPDPTVIEGGLEKLQEALDTLKKGISFGKVVVIL